MCVEKFQTANIHQQRRAQDDSELTLEEDSMVYLSYINLLYNPSERR